MSGTLIIRPQCAKLTRDTETFGKMDPFCELTIGQQKFKTSVANDQSKNPVWKDTFTFNRTNEDVIKIDVFDYDNISQNDYIATGSFALTQVLKPIKSSNWIPLEYKGKSAGQILIEFEFLTNQPQQNVLPQGQFPQQQFPQQQFPQQQYPQGQQQFPPQQQQFPPQQQQFPQGQFPQQQQQQQYPPQQQGQFPPQQQYPPQQFPQQGQFPPQQFPQQGQFPPQQFPQQQQFPPQQFPQQQQQNIPLFPQQIQQNPYPNQQIQQQQQFIPYQGQQIMMIKFNPNCSKCKGTGWKIKKNKEKKPCSQCYESMGICKKCLGTGINLKKGGACKCKGKKHH